MCEPHYDFLHYTTRALLLKCLEICAATIFSNLVWTREDGADFPSQFIALLLQLRNSKRMNSEYYSTNGPVITPEKSGKLGSRRNICALKTGANLNIIADRKKRGMFADYFSEIPVIYN